MTDERVKSKTAGSRSVRRLIKRILTALVVLAVIAGVVMTAMPKPVPVELGRAERGELVVTVDEDGKTRVKDRYIVSAPLSGNLGRIELRAGDEVKQGEVLARLVPLQAPLLDARSRSETEARVSAALASQRQVQAQIERAEVAYDFARKEAERHKSLFADKAISQMELDRVLSDERARKAELTSAQFGAKVAAHELRMTRAALGRYDSRENTDSLTVPSPVSGRVLKVIQQSEGVIQAGAPLLEVGDPKALEIVVDVLTSDAVSIRPGSPVHIDEWGGETLDAVVRTVEPSAFTRLSALGVEEQRVNAIIDLTAPYEDWSQLGDGYRVEARIEVFRADNALKIPQSSLFRQDASWAAFIVEGNVAKLKQLEVGRRNDTHAEVLSGLSEGQTIVVHPNDDVVDTVEVTPM